MFRITYPDNNVCWLHQVLPGYEVELALAEGPFEDDDGVGAHFEALALQKGSSLVKQIGALKVDLHVSVIKLARHAVMQKPKLIVGHGQGAIIAIAYGHPGCFEQVLATRNVGANLLHEGNTCFMAAGLTGCRADVHTEGPAGADRLVSHSADRNGKGSRVSQHTSIVPKMSTPTPPTTAINTHRTR